MVGEGGQLPLLTLSKVLMMMGTWGSTMTATNLFSEDGMTMNSP